MLQMCCSLGSMLCYENIYAWLICLGIKTTWLDLGKGHCWLTWNTCFATNMAGDVPTSPKKYPAFVAQAWLESGFTLANAEKQSWTVLNCLAWQPFFPTPPPDTKVRSCACNVHVIWQASTNVKIWVYWPFEVVHPAGLQWARSATGGG